MLRNGLRLQQPADYGRELGRILQQFAQVAERLHGVEQTFVLRQGVKHYARMLERSGSTSHNKQAFHRKDQDLRMWVADLIGVRAPAYS